MSLSVPNARAVVTVARNGYLRRALQHDSFDDNVDMQATPNFTIFEGERERESHFVPHHGVR